MMVGYQKALVSIINDFNKVTYVLMPELIGTWIWSYRICYALSKMPVMGGRTKTWYR